MISQREKGIYFNFCTAQIGLAVLLFAVFYLINDRIRETWLASPAGYIQLLLVMLITLIGEAVLRPDSQRVNVGRAPRRLALVLARRQALWLAAGFGVFLALTRDTSISRAFLIGFAVLSYPLFFLTNRHGRFWMNKLFGNRGVQLKLRTLIIGSPDWSESIRDKLAGYPEFFDTELLLTVPKDAPVEGILDQVTARGPDLLVLPSHEFPYETVTQLLALGDRRGFRCWLPVEMSRRHGRRFELQDLGGLSVLSPPTLPLAVTYNRALKRAFDLGVSTVVVPTVVLPLMAVVAVIQRLSSPGPLFYRQQRVGENGMIFEILKFRTMHVSNDDETRQAARGDERIYRGGQWLRRLSIDEFPQFLNVLRGEMSVVGPRPHMIAHEREFEKFHELYGSRRYVKPGVTGLAQVEGYRGEVRDAADVRGRARYDLFYVRHWCLGLDIRLALQTMGVLINPPTKAY
ncbi:MAG: sugar transferase [Chthoniobacterales bacterium]|nr:sugar transferase [Chthoniobacterales bacterium]